MSRPKGKGQSVSVRREPLSSDIVPSQWAGTYPTYIAEMKRRARFRVVSPREALEEMLRINHFEHDVKVDMHPEASGYILTASENVDLEKLEQKAREVLPVDFVLEVRR